MTREEKQKAIYALNKSVPLMGTTQEGFIVYKQTINKVVDWLEQESKAEWIPCSERLPLERNAVLVWSINNTYCAYLEDGKWYIFGAYDWELKEVTAWMPLPEPYKGRNGEKR